MIGHRQNAQEAENAGASGQQLMAEIRALLVWHTPRATPGGRLPKWRWLAIDVSVPMTLKLFSDRRGTVRLLPGSAERSVFRGWWGQYRAG